MGCSSSLENLSKHKDDIETREVANNNGAPILTLKQKYLIKKTWKLISIDPTEIGIQLFLHLFTIKPEVKQVFRFGTKDNSDLLNDHVFRSHASRFIQTIGATVEGLDNPNMNIASLLRNLGRQHLKYPDTDHVYFKYFVEAMMCTLQDVLKAKFTSDVQTAWLYILEFIVLNLAEGFQNVKT